MTRQDEPTDRISNHTLTCLRCGAREYGTGNWNQRDCQPGLVHLGVAPVRLRGRQEPDGLRAAMATALAQPPPVKHATWLAWLTFGFGCALAGALFAYAIAKTVAKAKGFDL